MRKNIPSRGNRYFSVESESESEVAQSCPTLCNLWTVAHQAPPSMGFSRQEYWRVLPFPSPGDLPDPGIEPRCPTLQADLCTTREALSVEGGGCDWNVGDEQVGHEVTVEV